jgi:hypothetical protein
MIGQLITSLNWTLGSLALALALAGPKLVDTLLTRVSEAEALYATSQIEDGQGAYYALHKRNLEFSRYTAGRVLTNLNVQLDLNSSSYNYDGFYSEDGAYIIRAATRPEKLGKRDSVLPSYFPVRIYRRVLSGPDGGGTEEKSGWVQMSNQKPGILTLFFD